jgi:hypothetical protein
VIALHLIVDVQNDCDVDLLNTMLLSVRSNARIAILANSRRDVSESCRWINAAAPAAAPSVRVLSSLRTIGG